MDFAIAASSPEFEEEPCHSWSVPGQLPQDQLLGSFPPPGDTLFLFITSLWVSVKFSSFPFHMTVAAPV